MKSEMVQASLVNIESTTPCVAEQKSTGRLSRALHIGKRAVESATAAFLIGPTNEIARVAATGTVFATTHDAYLATATWGGSTLIIESAAALVTSDLLDSEGGKKWTDWFNRKASKVGIKEDTKLNAVTKAGISFMAGSGVATFVEHRENPERTRVQNIRYGLKNAAALSVACTAQGYLVTEGLANPSPVTIGGAVVGVGSVIGISKWAKSKIKESGEKVDK